MRAQSPTSPLGWFVACQRGKSMSSVLHTSGMLSGAPCGTPTRTPSCITTPTYAGCCGSTKGRRCMQNSSFVQLIKTYRRSPVRWCQGVSCRRRPVQSQEMRVTHALYSSSPTTSVGGWKFQTGCATSSNCNSGRSPPTTPPVMSPLTARGHGTRRSSRTLTSER
uniref:Uncharacterized protein n=1 Tax=Triticum urartu TaxID=4572 RepID=A0A8R7TJG0_TRIUA